MPSRRDVGIVMPIYHQSDGYLRAAVNSILKQSYRHFKLVIVLDGAGAAVERTVHQLCRGDRRVRIIRFPHNRGIVAALNRGFKSLLRRRNIRYLTWVSSDNVYYSNYLQELRHKLRRSSSHVGLVYSSFRHVNAAGYPVFDTEYRRAFRAWQNQPKDNLLEVCFVGTSFMYKRRHAEKTGNYANHPVEDYDYWLRLTDHCDIAFLDKELMDYRVASKHSISRRLGSSERQHRRWRYAYQSAKNDARKRRSIATELTVVARANIFHDETRPIVERLYEDAFSNYELVVVDSSSEQAVTTHLRKIRDPRVRFHAVADGTSVETVVASLIENRTSPYALTVNLDEHPSIPALLTLISRLRAGEIGPVITL